MGLVMVIGRYGHLGLGMVMGRPHRMWSSTRDVVL